MARCARHGRITCAGCPTQRGNRAVDPARCQALIDTLEADPSKVPLFYLHLENAIAWCMDEIYGFAKSGEDDEKMTLVALEYRARLVLERYQKLSAN